MEKRIGIGLLSIVFVGLVVFILSGKKTDQSPGQGQSASTSPSSGQESAAESLAASAADSMDESGAAADSERPSGAASAQAEPGKMGPPKPGSLYRLSLKDDVIRATPEEVAEAVRKEETLQRQMVESKVFGETVVLCVAPKASCLGPADSDGHCVTARQNCNNPTGARVLSQVQMADALGGKKANSVHTKLEFLQRTGRSRE